MTFFVPLLLLQGRLLFLQHNLSLQFVLLLKRRFFVALLAVHHVPPRLRKAVTQSFFPRQVVLENVVLVLVSLGHRVFVQQLMLLDDIVRVQLLGHQRLHLHLFQPFQVVLALDPLFVHGLVLHRLLGLEVRPSLRLRLGHVIPRRRFQVAQVVVQGMPLPHRCHFVGLEGAKSRRVHLLHAAALGV
ncbi:hypothetical protein H257_14618 [Aphanomyces astaci]|uniref:Secreted protein n=1 Tax=Aphanomyces astaci TaxID=112090 RepID=W4FT10_APHAT|nr:hypothetical protein H257_14618 [Aphanomyces astaci]ETV69793.1 hypothetical protein H257_14618 [Aphanomyces astaci]|eukprot:XP_009840807.1 hypothetical protein H257_14618 [Aphanomyces astaci]